MNSRISLSALSKAGLTIEMALLALLPFREKQKSFCHRTAESIIRVSQY